MSRALKILLALLMLLLSGCNVIRLHHNQMKAGAEDLGLRQQSLALQDGGTLSFWAGGEGEPLLLIHGFGGDALANWRKVIKPLSSNYQLIVPDLLWFGDSSSPSPPSLELQAQAMLALLDALKLANVHVVGLSYGGFVAYSLLREPTRIKTLTLIASPGPQFGDDDVNALKKRLAITTVEEMFVPDDGQEVLRLIEASFADVPAFTWLVSGGIYRVYFQANREQKRQLLRQLPQARDKLLSSTPRHLPPSLVLWGEHDQIFLLKDANEVSQALDAELVVIPDAGHAVPIEQPKQVLRSLDRFIEQQTSTGVD